MADFDQELDASGLNCPLPILRAKKTLSSMDAGQILHIIATDPGSVKDFEPSPSKPETSSWSRRKRVASSTF